MQLAVTDVHPFHQLIIALILGLLVGLQRQWAESERFRWFLCSEPLVRFCLNSMEFGWWR